MFGIQCSVSSVQYSAFSIQRSVFSESARQLYRRSSPAEIAHTIFEEIASSGYRPPRKVITHYALMVMSITAGVTEREHPIFSREQLQRPAVGAYQVVGVEGGLSRPNGEQFFIEQYHSIEAFGCHL